MTKKVGDYISFVGANGELSIGVITKVNGLETEFLTGCPDCGYDEGHEEGCPATEVQDEEDLH